MFTDTRHTIQSSVTWIQPTLQEPRVLIHFHITFPTTSIVIKITVHLVVCRDMTSCCNLLVHRRRHSWGTSGCSFSETLSTTWYQDTRRHIQKQNYLHNYLSEHWMSQNWKSCLKKSHKTPSTAPAIFNFIHWKF